MSARRRQRNAQRHGARCNGDRMSIRNPKFPKTLGFLQNLGVPPEPWGPSKTLGYVRAMLASGKAVQYQPPPISVRTITRHVGVNKRAGMEYYCASLVPVRAACGDWLRPLYIRGTGAHPLGGFSYIRSFAPPKQATAPHTGRPLFYEPHRTLAQAAAYHV